MKFSELGLAERISNDLEKLGFTQPTEIQEKAIPPILAGHDIMASAETGSGKTAAYALPIVQALRGGSKPLPRALVLVPTRELAIQVSEQMVRFANKCGIRTVTIYGGAGFEKQARLLKRGVDVIVATPGRLFDHILQGNAKLSDVNFLVLDEADRMLDMGFTPQVRRIVEEIDGPRQTVMFSATINKAVAKTGEEFLNEPITIAANSNRVEPASIAQEIRLVKEGEKTQLLVELLGTQVSPQSPSTVLVFTKTRVRATKICKVLNAASLPAGEIHSDISQNKREATLRKFRDGQISVLVATDVAARGLDVPTISHVYNYDLPLSAADYVHRIGRTGRAGRSGIAISFVSDEQRYLVPDIEKVTGRELDPDSPFRKTRDGAKNSKNSRNHKSRSGSGNTNRNRGYSNNGGRNFGTRERTHSAVAGVHAESGDFNAPQIQTPIQTKDRVVVESHKPVREFNEFRKPKEHNESKFGTRAKEFGDKSKEYGGKSKEFGGKPKEFGGKSKEFGGKSKEFGSKSKQFGGKSREHSKSEGFESFFKESYDEVFSGSKSRPAFGQKARQGQGSRHGQSASSRHGQGHSANNHKPSRNKLVKIGKKRGSR
jgi:superfamily II DNA/RNA helicase